MFELQSFVLGKTPSRRQLLEYAPISRNAVKVCVYRNHSFELVEHTIGAFLDFAGLKADFVYSDYDDSLSFIDLPSDADLLILWLDLARYKIASVETFVNERIAALKTSFKKPVLLVPVGGAIKSSVPTLDLSELQKELGDRFFDERLESATGTRLSSAALIRIAKELGLRYIPALTLSPLKGIVVDLDNTLYEGVLGEDGADGVRLTDGHKKLQSFLKEKAENGWFVCVASKNDERDVFDLFEKRKDFPLKRSDFTMICASWSEKSESVKKILKALNVGADSLLFVDDNAGEVSSMAAAYPQMKTLLASSDGEETYRMLSFYPGLMKFAIGSDDKIRKADVQSNALRNEMQAKLSKEDYIRSLEMKIVFSVDAVDSAPRIAELANKTNQFIFNYKRYKQDEVLSLMSGKDSVVVSAKLSDKLSDSGTVGVVAGKKIGDGSFDLEECFVSCRALGRGIDDILVLGMIQTAMKEVGADRLIVRFQKGERNLPAETFVEKYLKKFVNASKAFAFDRDDSLVQIEIIKGR